MKKIKLMFVSIATLAFTIFAYIGAASACTANLYQPELPENLRKF